MLQSLLGFVIAYLGSRDRAIDAGRKAMDIMPISSRHYWGPPVVGVMAEKYTLTGDHDKAIDEIEYLLPIPARISESWLDITQYSSR